MKASGVHGGSCFRNFRDPGNALSEVSEALDSTGKPGVERCQLLLASHTSFSLG